jgi:FkbM family methyltransferase
VTLLASGSTLARRLPASRAKVRLGRLLAAIATRLGADPLVTVSLPHGRYRLDARSRTEAELLWNGRYAQGELDFLRVCTPHDGIFVDVGATVGMVFVPMRHHLGSRGLAVAIEPVPVNVERLRATIQLNDFAAPGHVVASGVGDRPGRLAMAKEGPSAASGNAVLRTEASRPEWLEVEVTTLDDVVDGLELPPGAAVTIKLDVEGYEVEVLLGARRMLAALRPVIVGEFNNQLLPLRGWSFLDAWALVEPLGYRCFAFATGTHLVERGDPHPSIGDVALVPAERVDDLVARGIRIDVAPGRQAEQSHVTERLFVVIATRDDAGTVQRVLREVRGVLPAAAIVVVDASSRDATVARVQAVAEEVGAVTVLTSERPCGLAAAYRVGLDHALTAGATVCGQMGADGSVSPRALLVLLAYVQADVDVARAAPPWPNEPRGLRSWARRGTKLGRRVSARSGVLHLDDPGVGVQVWRAEALRHVALGSAPARRGELRVATVPVRFAADTGR